MKIETVIAANRFGLGARPGELQEVGRNPLAWLLDQLSGPARTPVEFTDLPSTASVLIEVQELRDMRREVRQASDDDPAPDVVRQYGAIVRKHFMQQANARFRHAVSTDLPFFERLVHFWSNHFAVSADKQPLSAVAGLFENEAIRPNLDRKFADLLIAAESHPAMILYLDNQRSIGPNSPLAKRAARRRDQEVGLNENLAREILELHSLGVDGGYSQADVTALARVITGWSIGGGPGGRLREGKPGMFEFRESIHEPGPQTVLGKTYRQDGMRQGIAVFGDLATHPSTARFISTKLARHFVADVPPSSAVSTIEQVFLDTGGSLPAIHEAVVRVTEAWQQPLVKYKTPQDFVISAFRAFDRVPDNPRFIVGALDLMGQTPFRPGSPAGWPDTAAAWGGADALYKRIEWASTVGRFAGARARPVELAESVLGPVLSPATAKAIARAESVKQGLTLFLASPEFQRR